PGTRDQGPGTRDQGPGTRDQGPFGLSPEWLLAKGRPVADTFVLSHPDQLRTVETLAPAALSAMLVAGDPCLDRIVESLPLRDRYRAELGIGGRRLVVITSTWSRTSLLGKRPDLPRELLSELSPDSYAVALVLHPNISHGHGFAAVRQWYADCLRSGMLILDEIDGWRAGLVASDVVIGDHGSVTGYAAALGRPAILGAFDDVPPGTPIAALGELAPRLPLAGPYEGTIEAALASRLSDRFQPIAQLASAMPGESLSALRRHFYSLMKLSEPSTEVSVAAVAAKNLATRGPAAGAHFVSGEADVEARTVQLARRAAEVQRTEFGGAADVHVNCSVDYPIRSLRTSAAVLNSRPGDEGTDSEQWHAALFARYPSCAVSSLSSEGKADVRLRSGPALTLRAPGVAGEVLASIPYIWANAGTDALAGAVELTLDGRTHRVEIEHSG
ncbi:hypothetical protein ACFFRC_05525, partial [Amycolatopsis halotolerans]